MTTEAPSGSPKERIRRSRAEIAPILEILQARRDPIRAHLLGGDLLFESRLRIVDRIGSFIVLEASPDEAANAALLSRARCSFFAAPPDRHVEFAASDPQMVELAGAPAIRLRFPDVLVELQRREHDRATVSREIPLECLADAGGVLSFRGSLVDVGVGGLSFLLYHPSITLEPGTVLKGCRVQPDDLEPLILDLEVRYSELVLLADGTRAERSGCKVVAHPETLKEFVQRLSA